MSQQPTQQPQAPIKTRTEADAVVETVERLLAPHLCEVKEVGGEAVPILIASKGLEVFDLEEHLAPVRKAPRRRKGTAVLCDLPSFIAHAKRFADRGSALFADTTGGCSLTCVHDYHPPGAEAAPRFGEHRSVYRFPFSDEWVQWTQKNGAQLSQAAFAEFVESRALDFLDPSEASARAKEIATTLGVAYAPPIKMLDASRGLSLHQNSRVKQAQKLDHLRQRVGAGAPMTFSIHHGEAYAWLRTLTSASLDACVTDPPYSSGGFTRGDRALNPSEKYRQSAAPETTADFSGDNRDQRSFLAWCTLWLTEVHRVLRDGAPIVLFTDWRQLPVTTDAMQCGGFVWRGVAVWTKNNASRPQMGRYRSDTEFAVWGSKGPMPQRVDVGVLPGTWDHEPAPSWCVSPVHVSERLHLTEKPLELMDAVVAIAPPGGLVLDPFAGSGTTGVAAIRSARHFLGAELSDYYHAIASERLRAEASGSTIKASQAGQGALFGGAP